MLLLACPCCQHKKMRTADGCFNKKIKMIGASKKYKADITLWFGSNNSKAMALQNILCYDNGKPE